MDIFGIDAFKKLITDLRAGTVTIVVEVKLKDNAPHGEQDDSGAIQRPVD